MGVPGTVLAAIDVGTNSVLLTVCRSEPSGALTTLVERAEITRLGRGVDRDHRLSEPAMELTLRVLGAYVEEALGLGVPSPAAIACVATSAARDAENGPDFLARVRQEVGVTLEIIEGQREAELTFGAVRADFPAVAHLAVVDVGGGSTELAIEADRPGGVALSLPIGSVRLFERCRGERAQVAAAIAAGLSGLSPLAAESRLVGVAGTWTTLAMLARASPSYVAAEIHGLRLPLAEVTALEDRLWGLSLAQRLLLPGLQPGRADVIPVGASIAVQLLRTLGAIEITISDRGVRWGLLRERRLASPGLAPPLPPGTPD